MGRLGGKEKSKGKKEKIQEWNLPAWNLPAQNLGESSSESQAGLVAPGKMQNGSLTRISPLSPPCLFRRLSPLKGRQLVPKRGPNRHPAPLNNRLHAIASHLCPSHPGSSLLSDNRGTGIPWEGFCQRTYFVDMLSDYFLIEAVFFN